MITLMATRYVPIYSAFYQARGVGACLPAETHCQNIHNCLTIQKMEVKNSQTI